MPSGRAREQPRQIGLAHRERQVPQILTIEREAIEGVKLHLLVVLARVQRVEIGDAVDSQDDGLTIDDEMLLPVLQRAIDDPREAAAPVVAVACEKSHALVLADEDQAVAIVFDLMKPFRPCRHGFAGMPIEKVLQ
jgi:hypothetical protein